MIEDRILGAAIDEYLNSFKRWTESEEEQQIFRGLVDEVIKVLRSDNKLIFCGNGGSAAEASHLAAEFVGKCETDVGAQAAISLTDSGVFLTAVANDWSFDDVFCRQLRALGNPGDLVIGLSTSGTSRNVLSALKLGKEMGLATSMWTSTRNNLSKKDIDFLIRVPCLRTPRAQELHLFIGHVLCEYVEEAFAPKK